MFDDSGVDTLIFQDGVGLADQAAWKSIAPYIEAISMIDDEFATVDLWFVAEIFTQIDGLEINGKPF